MAVKMAIRGLQMALEPSLPYPLSWEEDVQPVVEEMLETEEEVEEAMGELETFMEALLQELKKTKARVKLVLGPPEHACIRTYIITFVNPYMGELLRGPPEQVWAMRVRNLA